MDNKATKTPDRAVGRLQAEQRKQLMLFLACSAVMVVTSLLLLLVNRRTGQVSGLAVAELAAFSVVIYALWVGVGVRRREPARPGDPVRDPTGLGVRLAPSATARKEGEANMTRNVDQRRAGATKCLLAILGYVMAFAIPAGLLAWLLPSRCAPWISLTTVFLFFAVASCYCGMQWDLPALPEESRSFLRRLPLASLPWILPEIPKEGRRFVKWLPLIVLLPTLVGVVDSIRKRELTAMLSFLVWFISAFYPPFFLGRFVALRRHGLRAG